MEESGSFTLPPLCPGERLPATYIKEGSWAPIVAVKKIASLTFAANDRHPVSE
jgi:hypothetical protein